LLPGIFCVVGGLIFRRKRLKKGNILTIN
jgi:hypothetical protein